MRKAATAAKRTHPANGGDAKAAARPESERMPQPQRLILSIAEQSGIGDAGSCRAVLSILSASRAIRHTLEGELSGEDAAETRYDVLVTLYALEPHPATVADLEPHVPGGPSAVSRVLEDLEARGLVSWGGEYWNRHARIHLTELGGHVVAEAVRRFLVLASKLAGSLRESNRAITVKTCREIESRAVAQRAQPNPS